jgi:hypothetical protein
MRSPPALRDETWRLALTGDAAGLAHAATVLEGGGLAYEARRAEAFALATAGSAGAALDVLATARADGWPLAPAYGLDRARVLLLADDAAGALRELRAAAPPGVPLDPAVPALARLAARTPRLRLRALGLVLGAGTLRERAANALAVATGWRGRSSRTARPTRGARAPLGRRPAE